MYNIVIILVAGAILLGAGRPYKEEDELFFCHVVGKERKEGNSSP